jgi:hypothetical protein
LSIGNFHFKVSSGSPHFAELPNTLRVIKSVLAWGLLAFFEIELAQEREG